MSSPDPTPNENAPRGPAVPPREPAFNIPGLLVALVAVFAAVQLIIDHGPRGLASDLFINLAFFPARLGASEAVQAQFFVGPSWFSAFTFVTYGLLHGGWLHLAVNALWLVTFGAPVVRRLGTSRFLILLIVGTVAGALTHLLIHWGSVTPLVGASAGISAIMGGAVRFVFDPRDRGLFTAVQHPEIVRNRPLQPLRDLWANPTVLMFTGMLILTNVLFGAISVPGVSEGSSIAWQAHIGGFAAGFFAFPLIDHVPRRGRPGSES
ncbi:MAG: rhomboid family intramembrane serine protease [Devosiaceae bacterium]|nr:rhomboid family intramembrane serine protease [Devosiaceae bacterium MH13]